MAENNTAIELLEKRLRDVMAQNYELQKRNTELGEAANVLKKLNRVRDGIPGNAETPDQLHAQFADELADTFIYLDLLAQAAGVDLPSAIRSKFNRTSAKIGYVPA
jgi:NTP pyrophosphatase (non-canonical NTP hydrolase)